MTCQQLGVDTTSTNEQTNLDWNMANKAVVISNNNEDQY